MSSGGADGGAGDQLPPGQLERSGDHSGISHRGSTLTDLAGERSERQRGRPSRGTEDSAERFDIGHLIRAVRAVRFDRVDLRGFEPRRLQSVADRLFGCAGRVLDIGRHAQATDHGEHGIAVAFGGVEPLQRHHGDSLAGHGRESVIAEGTGRAIERQLFSARHDRLIGAIVHRLIGARADDQIAVAAS